MVATYQAGSRVRQRSATSDVLEAPAKKAHNNSDHKESEVRTMGYTKEMRAAKAAQLAAEAERKAAEAQAADQADIFAPVAPGVEAQAADQVSASADPDPFEPSDLDDSIPPNPAPSPPADPPAQASADNTPGAHFEASADNTPIDINSGEAVTTGFFLDLTKDDGFELIAAGTRAVVSCVASDAVLSNNGNPMLNLRVKIERVRGAPDMSKAPLYRNRSVKDRLMFIPPNDVTGSRGTIWRARLAFAAFDVEFDAKAFRTQAEFMQWLTAKAELFIGSVAEVVIGVDDGTSGGTKAPQINPETGDPYQPKNTIAQYFKYNAQAASVTSGIGATEDLPF